MNSIYFCKLQKLLSREIYDYSISNGLSNELIQKLSQLSSQTEICKLLKKSPKELIHFAEKCLNANFIALNPAFTARIFHKLVIKRNHQGKYPFTHLQRRTALKILDQRENKEKEIVQQLNENPAKFVKFIEESLRAKHASVILKEIGIKKLEEVFDTKVKHKKKDRILKIINDNKDFAIKYLDRNFEFFNKKINRLILSAQSPYLRKILEGRSQYAEGSYHPDTLDCIAEYLSTSQLPEIKDLSIAQEVLSLAQEWLIDGLQEHYMAHHPINGDNVMLYYQLAHQSDNVALKTQALAFVDEHLSFEEVKGIYPFNQEGHAELKTICKLKVILNHVSKKYFQILTDPSQQQKTLQESNLSFLKDAHCSFSTEQLARLSATELACLLLFYPENVEELNLSPYNDPEIAFLVYLLPPCLMNIDLSRTALSEQTITTLVERCPNLKKLNLENAKKWNLESPFDISTVS